MNFVVITPTCRVEPRFRDMADTISANLEALATPSDHPPELTWIVVDDRLWHEDPEARKRLLLDAVDDRFTLVHVPPKASEFRGPHRKSLEDLPDHNGARNTGLQVAVSLLPDDGHFQVIDDTYVVFLDDNTVMSQSVLTMAVMAFAKGVCLRVPMHFTKDLAIPRGGRVAFKESGGSVLKAAFATTVAGGCFGAPMRAFLDIKGFDEVYAGDRGKQDIDAFVRMERAGWRWETSSRCAAIQLGKTHTKTELGRHTLTGKNSLVHWQKLLKERNRTLPQKGCDLQELVEAETEAPTLKLVAPASVDINAETAEPLL